MNQYGNIPILPSVLILLLLATYLGLFVAVFSSLMSFFLRHVPHQSSLILAGPAVWVSLEILRTHLFTGYPWALLGYSQYQWLSIIQIADITGVYGVSFLVVLVNLFLALLIETLTIWFREHPKIRIVSMVLPAAITTSLFVLTLSYGQFKQETLHKTTDQRNIHLGLVQPNIDQRKKWDPSFRKETIDRYLTLTTQAIKKHGPDKVDLIVWPEASTPFVFELENTFRDQITTLVQTHQTPLLFGSIAVKEITEQSAQLLNRAYLLSSQGSILNHYDKMHLVPFGEYVPRFFSFIDKLAHGVGDYVPSNEHTIMSGPHGRFGVAICFEVIYPDLVRRFVKHGAEYMITMTNDAWYDHSSAPYQHFSMVVFRAIENRVSFARAANTGISGFINADGTIKQKTNLFEKTTIVDTVKLGHDQTIYTAYGDIFAYTCTGFTLGLILVAFARQNKRQKNG